ncbi:MAG: TonB-dependent receptor [Acidobacteriaceae bacterium]|nr:TonB-dependent receptor [Acidobacteriaceae bacterium]
MSKRIDLKTSLVAGVFGTPSDAHTASPTSALLATEDNSKAVAGRKSSWAAALTLTVAGLVGSNAVAAPTEPSKNKDLGEEVNPETAASSSQTGTPASEVHKFNIPAGTVADVMEALRKQVGIRIALSAQDKMASIASPGVQGVVSLEDALAQALANTGLSARFDAPDSVVVELRSNRESVVVTADSTPNIKYTASLLDLPQTVTVIGQQTMQNTASTTLVEALRTVPGITFGAGEGGNPLGDRPFIRGMDAQSSTYIDGLRDIAAQSREVFDIDSIEVAEGPGGAYGGRGTGGGSINMNSKMARRKSFVTGTFMPGTANYKRATVDGNTDFGPFVSGRLTGMWNDADVAGRDVVHNNRWGIAPSLAVGLGHPTRLLLDYYHLVQNNIPDSGIPYNNPADKTGGVDPGTQILQPGDGEPFDVSDRRFFYGLADRDHDREVAKVATGRVEQDLFHGRSLLRNTFRYERTSMDYVVTLPDDSQGNLLYGYIFRRINSRVSTVFTEDNQTDLSGQFKTGHIKHSYATGIEFSKERGNNDSYTNNSTTATGGENCKFGTGAASLYNCTSLFAPTPYDPWLSTGQLTLTHNPNHSVAVTKSVYGFDTVEFNKHFQSTVGGRYDNFYSSYTAPVGNSLPKQSLVNNMGTYLASLVYKPDHATSIYGAVSTAAIPTGNSLSQGRDTSNLNTAGNSNLQPEQIRQEEIGAKRELAGGKAMARIDFFRTDIQNVRIPSATDPTTYIAAGTDRTLGAQIGIGGALTKRWNLNGGYTYLDAVLTNAGPEGTSAGLSNGTAMPNTARHSVSITSDYQIFSRLHAGGGVYTMTKQWGSQTNNKWVPGYARVDIFGNYIINSHLNLQANIQNLGDKLYYQQAYTTHYAIMAPGRQAVFGINVKF